MTEVQHNADDQAELARIAASYEMPPTELLERLQRSMATLPRFTRDVFLAHRVEEMSYSEIASLTGVSIQRIDREIARAIAAIDRGLHDPLPPTRWRQWRRLLKVNLPFSRQ